MAIEKYYLHAIMAFLFGAAALLIIPKEHNKRYFLYGLIFGAIVDIFTASSLLALGLAKYKNMGPFSVLDIFSFWTPISWMFAFSIFFYLLPVRKVFLIPYLIGFTGLSYSVGLIMEVLGLFEYIGVYRYIAPATFFIWYSVSAWVYLRQGNIELR